MEIVEKMETELTIADYKHALKHRLYVRYMDNPTEFMELSKLMDDVEELMKDNERRYFEFIKKLAADSRFVTMATEKGVMIIHGSKDVSENIKREDQDVT